MVKKQSIVSIIYFIINILILFILAITLLSCNNKAQTKEYQTEGVINDKTTERHIQSISVLFYNYIFNNNKPIRVEDIKLDIPNFKDSYKGVLDAEITDSVKLEKIKTLVNNLQDAKMSFPIDARIIAKIAYNDATADILVLSGEYSNSIYLNGIQKETNNELLFLLENNIGFYPWIIGDDMLNMTEIKDNSFPKEPFVSSQYYKDYQTVLSNR